MPRMAYILSKKSRCFVPAKPDEHIGNSHKLSQIERLLDFASPFSTISRDLGAELVHVGGVADHVHIVTTLPRTVSQAQLIEQIKKTFSNSLPSAPPPRPASGERIEVRGIRTFQKKR